MALMVDLNILTDPAVLSELIFQGLVRGAMYGLMGIGLSLIFGILGIVNFAHGELFMLGAYVMYFVAAVLGLPFVAGVAAAGVALFVIGRGDRARPDRAAAPARRPRLAAGFLRAHHRPDGDPAEPGADPIRQRAARRQTLIPGSVSFGEVTITYERLVILALACVVVLLLAAYVKFTRTGKAIRATAQHPRRRRRSASTSTGSTPSRSRSARR